MLKDEDGVERVCGCNTAVNDETMNRRAAFDSFFDATRLNMPHVFSCVRIMPTIGVH